MPDLFEAELKLPDEIYLKRKEDGIWEKDNVVYEGIAIDTNGISCQFKDAPEMKGYAKPSNIRAINVVKKAILSFLRVLQEAPFLIPFLWLARKPILKNFARFSNSTLRDYYYKPQYYISSAQEIYYAGMDMLTQGRIYENDWDTIGETNWNLLMLFVMAWDMENVYRYRAQYALEQIDIKELEKNPRKEVERVLDILIIREKEQVMKDKWIAVRKIVKWLPLKKLPTFISKMDMERMKLDKDDLWWAVKQGGFDYLN